MRATMSAPMLGCSRSITHSSSSSGPGLESTAPATAIVPTSCSSPARRRSPCRLSGSPSSRPTSSASSATPTSCSCGNALARSRGPGERGGDARSLPALVRGGLATALGRARARGGVALGRGERRLGGVQQGVDGRAGMRARRAGRDVHAQLVPARAHGLAGHRRDDLVADPAQRVAVAEVGHEHREAPAADVRDRVVGAHAVGQPARELAQHAVGDRVAALLVELAQAIDVEQHERRAGVLALRARQLAARDVEQVKAVEEPGRRIDAGAALGLLPCELQPDARALALAHVADHGVVGDRIAAAMRARPRPDPALDAVEAAQPVGRVGGLATRELLEVGVHQVPVVGVHGLVPDGRPIAANRVAGPRACARSPGRDAPTCCARRAGSRPRR